MKYNVLNMRTIYAMLIACATLMITACPEPEKVTTKNTGPFTVTFALDGGTGNDNTKSQTVLKGKMATKPTAPTKTDRTFGEWYQDKEHKVPFFFDTDTITKNITLYAKWNEQNHFTVRFNPNGGSAPNTIADQIIALGKTATSPPPPPPEKDHTFGGWYTDSTFNKTAFKFDTPITSNTTLYARWNKPDHFTVTFDTNDGSAIAEQIIALNNKATKPTTPTKAGFAFVDWYTDSALTIVFNFDTPITKNTTLYMKWVPVWNTVTTGHGHTVYIKEDNTLWGWGFNDYGQLGLRGDERRVITSPVQVSTATWSTVSAGAGHTVGIQTDGTLWAWGLNFYGQLGLGDKTNRSIPTKVGSATWSTVAARDSYTVGIQKDGTLWTWGYNWAGQLGLEDKTNRSIPTKVGSAKWSTVSAGDSHTVGIQKDGTFWAWGYNSSGQLGLKNKTRTILTPTKVDSATNWSTVAAGGYHTVGIKKDGTLWTWGKNANGQLGLGDTSDKTSPTKVGSATWKTVAAGDHRTFGIKKDGTLWMWGWNKYGQLGLGDTVDKKIPTKVGTATWQAVAVGWRHTVGIKEDGTFWAWGFNNAGHLGVGDTSDKTSPTQVKEAPATPPHSTGIQ